MRIFHSRPSIPLLLYPLLFSPSSFSLSPCRSHFARRCENQYFLAASASRTRGRNREGNSIGALFYKYLSSFESIGDRVLFSFLLRSFLLLVHGLFEAELPGVYLFLQIFYTFRTRICIHNGHGPEPALSSRLYFSSHSSPRSPFIPFPFLLSRIP